MARLLLLVTLVLVVSVVRAANDDVQVHQIADLPIPSPGSAASSTPADGTSSPRQVFSRSRAIKYAYSCWTNSIPQGSNSLFTVSVRPNKLLSCFTACAIYKKNGCKGFVWSQKHSACVLKKKVTKIYYPFYGYVTCSIRWL